MLQRTVCSYLIFGKQLEKGICVSLSISSQIPYRAAFSCTVSGCKTI
jgi:hypothetical protein